MASPRKRLRVSQRTAISVGQSTPQHSLGTRSSPSISSITNTDEEISERSITGRRLSFKSSSTLSPVSEEDDFEGEDYDAYFKDLEIIRYKGQTWKLYKPVEEENTLYANILENPALAHIIVTEFLAVYNKNPDKGIKILIQFFVNLAGYKNFNVSPHYNISTFSQSSKSIIDMLETDEVIEQNNLVMEGKYLLAERNITLMKTLRMGVYNFIQKLIHLSHKQEILYDQKFMVYILEFIKFMQISQARCVRHTGVVIGVKVLTALILLYNDVLNDSNVSMDSSEIANDSRAADQKSSLESFIECLYFVFIKNCRLRDNKVYQMRLECIYEAKIWMKYFPKLFISTYQTLNYIMKLIVDMSKEVRMAALSACEEIFNIPQVVQYLQPIIKEMTETIAKRFWDLDIKVAVKALNIITLFFQLDKHYISEEISSDIRNLIFDQYAPVGIAASNFLIKYFQTMAKNSMEILLLIATFYSEKTGDCIKELLVEGLLYVCEPIQDWELFCGMLLEGIFDNNTNLYLAEIFSEAVYQRISGKSDKMRNMSKAVIAVDISVHEHVAEIFPLLHKILAKQNNPKILTEMLRIIPLVNYHHLKKNYCKEYTDIADTISVIFNNHNDETLLKKAAEVISYLLTLPDIAKRAETISERLCDENITDLQEFFDNSSDNVSLAANKVAILYQHFNLNEQLSFEQLTVLVEEVNDQAALGFLECCKCYLIWDLKKSTENAGSQTQSQIDNVLSELPQKCKIFFMISFNMLQNKEKDQTFLIQVYGIFCDFCRSFEEELESPIKVNGIFTNLNLNIEEEEMSKFLIEFLEKNIMPNKEMSLFQRRTNLLRYIDIIQLGVLPINNLANIFKYYQAYNEEYGPIIDQYLADLEKNCQDNTAYLIVVYTLKTVYEDILKKHGRVDVRSDDAIQLKILAKKFSTLKMFSKSEKSLYTLYILMKYAFKNETTLSFLYSIKPFLRWIKDMEMQKNIYDSFKSLIPKKFEKDDNVLYFGRILKSIEFTKDKNPIPAHSSSVDIPPTTPKTPKSKGKENKSPKSKKRSKKDKENVPSKASTSTSSKSKTSKNKGRRNLGTQSTESSEDDMTIHDSESDDIDEHMSSMNIQSGDSK